MAEAYPLIRRATHVSADRWEKFGLELVAQGGGVLAAFAEDDHVHGIAAYLPVISLKHGNALHVETIAAFEFGHVSLVRNALSAALDRLAREKDCGVVSISLDARGLFNPRSRRRQGWESLGLTAETIEFVRPIDPKHSRSGRSPQASVRT